MAQSAHHVLFQVLFTALADVLRLGGCGVAIFFVVSGFCIHLSHRRSGGSGWPVFFTRRVFRLYPAYLVCLLFLLVLLPTTSWTDRPFSLGRGIDLVLHLLLAHNFLPQTLSSLDAPCWSLAIEFQLYLLFPLLLLLARRIGWRQTLTVTAVVELVTRLTLTMVSLSEPDIYPADWWGWLDLSPFGFWFSWAIGAAMAEAFVEKQPLPFANGPFPLWIWLLLVLIVGSTPYLQNLTFPLAALGTAHFMAYFLNRDSGGGFNAPTFVARGLTFVGTISYSLYLIHLPLLVFLSSYRPRGHGRLFGYVLEMSCLAGSLLLVIAAAYLLYRFIELPGIAIGKLTVKGLRARRAGLRPA